MREEEDSYGFYEHNPVVPRNGAVSADWHDSDIRRAVILKILNNDEDEVTQYKENPSYADIGQAEFYEYTAEVGSLDADAQQLFREFAKAQLPVTFSKTNFDDLSNLHLEWSYPVYPRDVSLESQPFEPVYVTKPSIIDIGEPAFLQKDRRYGYIDDENGIHQPGVFVAHTYTTMPEFDKDLLQSYLSKKRPLGLLLDNRIKQELERCFELTTTRSDLKEFDFMPTFKSANSGENFRKDACGYITDGLIMLGHPFSGAAGYKYPNKHDIDDSILTEMAKSNRVEPNYMELIYQTHERLAYIKRYFYDWLYSDPFIDSNERSVVLPSSSLRLVYLALKLQLSSRKRQHTESHKGPTAFYYSEGSDDPEDFDESDELLAAGRKLAESGNVLKLFGITK